MGQKHSHAPHLSLSGDSSARLSIENRLYLPVSSSKNHIVSTLGFLKVITGHPDHISHAQKCLKFHLYRAKLNIYCIFVHLQR